MPNSFAQTAHLTCPDCGQDFEAQIWLIVDAAENPDLLARAAAGTLHDTPCPRCGHAGAVDAPLLLYRTGWDVLAFSPAQGTTQEQDREQAGGLLGRLRAQLGERWRDEWLRQVATVPRPLVGVYLLEGPEAMQRRWNELQPEGAAPPAQDPGAPKEGAPKEGGEERPAAQEEEWQAWLAQNRPLLELLDRFIRARTWTESRQILEANPALLNEDADRLLQALIAAAQERNDTDFLQVLTQHRELLALCRENGIAAAFRALEQPQAEAGNIPDAVRPFLERLSGLTRLQDMPERVRACREALSRVNPQDHAALWAAIQVELGISLAQNPRGDRAENLEQAIAAFRLALQVRTQEAFPTDWAGTQNNLGAAYSDRIRGERAENLEQAIAAFRLALQVYTQEAFPEQWATTQNNLGAAYRDRIRGERAENLEQAIAAFRLALQVRTQEAFPEQWATTQNNLGNAYKDRIRGERAENLEQAIAAYRLALQVYTQEAFPTDWAGTQNNLGNAYSDRIRGERAENLEQAIAAFRLALQVYTQEAFPEQWATTQNNLGAAYRDRIRGERAENLEQAIAAFRLALQVRTQEAFPEQWATTQNNLGNAYKDRIRGERAENLEQAIAAYRLALQVYTQEAFPTDCLRTSRNLGSACFQAQRWAEAAGAYGTALQAGRILFGLSLLRGGQAYELSQMRDLPSRAAYALARIGRPEEAVEALENGRAQMLAQALERGRRDLHDLPRRGSREKQIYEQYTRAVSAYEALGRLGENRPPDWQAQMEAAGRAVSRAEEEIRSVPGYEGFLQPLDFAGIARLASPAPLVYLLATAHGGLALVVTGEQAHPVWLPGLTEPVLRGKLAGPADDREPGGYLGAYDRWRQNPVSPQARQAWMAALEDTTRWLWESAVRAVVEALLQQGHAQAVFIPAGLLGLLPLHAAWTEGEHGRSYAMEQVCFTYAPSAAALRAARGLAGVQPGSILAVDNPDGSLRFSYEEVTAAVDSFSERVVLAGSRASFENLKEALPRHAVLHFSTHGRAGFDQPLESRLLLAGGQSLTLGDLLDLRLPGARLAVLSACETGIPGTDLPDEVISLPSGFLQAGVGGVVGSLWAVSDASTMMLMARFYEAWRGEGLAPQEALRSAQTWLRVSSVEEKKRYFEAYSSRARQPRGELADPLGVRMPTQTANTILKELMATQDFSHPLYWAAFQYFGA